jgi:Methyltransferase domain
MRQAKQGPNRQPSLAGPSLDPLRIVPEAVPTHGTAPADEIGSFERRFWFGSEGGLELQYPARLVWPSPWVGHIPFASWLVDTLRPRVFVELGVHSGNSYCGFLQAIQSLALAAQCYGIDHWRGDEHSDYYGDDVYTELCSYHDPLYGTFSTLMRATFEEALPYFPDRSVDLLHIDGLHTHEGVAKDFSDWLPKLSARAVVLFHDINVREREFGVWQFWEEIAERYPTFAFVHSHGLGVAYLGSEPPPALLAALLATSDPDTVSRIRSYFARLGMSLVDRFARRQAEGIAARVRASEAELEAARAELRGHVETANTYRIEVGKASAQVAVLHDELTITKAEVVRQGEAATRLQDELSASRADTARQGEAAARLQEELWASRADTARQAEAASALQQQCSEARSELARQTEAASIRQTDAQKATDRIALLQDELEATRAEIARQLEAADAARATTEDLTGQVAALGEELFRARGQMSEAIAQRERATLLLRQQIAASAGLQRELAALTGRLGDLTAEHAAEVKRAADLALSNHEIRQQLDRSQQELRRVHASLAATLAQPRYVVADRCNAWAKKAGFLHAPLKRVWAAWHRGQ